MYLAINLQYSFNEIRQQLFSSYTPYSLEIKKEIKKSVSTRQGKQCTDISEGGEEENKKWIK